jgi:hypothetical protein
MSFMAALNRPDADGLAGGQGLGEHVVGVAADHREVAHLAAMAGVVLGVEVQAQAGHGVEQRPVGLAVAAGGSPPLIPQLAEQIDHDRGAVLARSPSGRPHRARTCCSYWLVTQASMVWWPLLWGRGHR